MKREAERSGSCHPYANRQPSPVRHWTDSKIRCHLFTCVAAVTYLRRIELKMAAAGHKRSIEESSRMESYCMIIKKASRSVISSR